MRFVDILCTLHRTKMFCCCLFTLLICYICTLDKCHQCFYQASCLYYGYTLLPPDQYIYIVFVFSIILTNKALFNLEFAESCTLFSRENIDYFVKVLSFIESCNKYIHKDFFIFLSS